LTPYFQIPGIRAWNQKLPIFRGGKPALIFPIGGQIAVQMCWSRGKGKRTPLVGVVVFRDLVLGCCRGVIGGEKRTSHTLPEGHHVSARTRNAGRG
jgi:hypothetical protein